MSKVENQGGLEIPPGVFRGADFFKRSLEVTREAQAAAIRARYADQGADLLIINKDRSDYLKLPPLAKDVFGRFPLWMPRYNKITGAIWTNRWNVPQVEEVEKGVAISEPDNYLILKKPGYRKEVNLSSIPKSWIVAVLIPQEVWGGIETAMRPQDILLTDYKTGAEQGTVSDLFVRIQQLTEIFKSQKVDKNSLEGLASDTSEFLSRLGLFDAEEELRTRITNSILNAFKQYPQGRINPLISRTYLRSAYLNTVRREVTGSLIRAKAAKVFEILAIERTITRDLLTGAKNTISDILGLGKSSGDPIFTEKYYFDHPDKIPDDELERVRLLLRLVVYENLRPVRVAPYLIPARLAEVMLISPKTSDNLDFIIKKGKRNIKGRIPSESSKNRKILEIGNIENEIRKPSVEVNLLNKNHYPAVRRLYHALGVLNSVLEDEDNMVYTTFSDQIPEQ